MNIPNLIRIETCTYCNEECNICPYVKLTRSKGYMDLEIFKHITDEHTRLASNPKILFPAAVGEPMLDKRIFEFISIASKKYSSVAMFSNASLLNLERGKRLFDSGLNEIMLTLHGLNEQSYTQITGYSHYHEVKENIMNFILLNEKNDKKIRIFLDIYSDTNAEEQNNDDLVQLARNSDVFLNLQPMSDTHNWGGSVGKEVYYRANKCHRMKEQFGVLHDGSIVPCCIDYNGEYVLGKYPENSLEEVFSSEKYKTLVKQGEYANYKNNPLCENCNLAD